MSAESRFNVFSVRIQSGLSDIARLPVESLATPER